MNSPTCFLSLWRYLREWTRFVVLFLIGFEFFQIIFIYYLVCFRYCEYPLKWKSLWTFISTLPAIFYATRSKTLQNLGLFIKNSYAGITTGNQIKCSFLGCRSFLILFQDEQNFDFRSLQIESKYNKFLIIYVFFLLIPF